MKRILLLALSVFKIQCMEHIITEPEALSILQRSASIEISKNIIKAVIIEDNTTSQTFKVEEYTFLIDGYEKTCTISAINQESTEERASHFSNNAGTYKDICFENIKKIALEINISKQ